MTAPLAVVEIATAARTSGALSRPSRSEDVDGGSDRRVTAIEVGRIGARISSTASHREGDLLSRLDVYDALRATSSSAAITTTAVVALSLIHI